MTNLKQRSKEINKDLNILQSSSQEKEALSNIINTIEELFQYVWELKKENQELKNEINKLKWEQWKPDIKPDVKPKDKENKEWKNWNISSESERKNNENKPKNKRGKKKDSIKIDREVICNVDKSILPADAVFKWYSQSICQDIIIKSDNILFKREHYYSPSLWKSFYWSKPKWFEWDFWASLKTFIDQLKYQWNMSEPKILDLLTTAKINISSFSILKILIKNNEPFHKEKNDIYMAGLNSTQYQQTDDTWEKVNWVSHKLHIMCNQFYSAYFTSKYKNRLTIIDILRNFKARTYILNNNTINLLEKFNISKKIITSIDEKIDKWKIFTEIEFDSIILELFPKLWKNNKSRIKESFAIAYYQQETDFPIIKILICDDAPQFKHITEFLGLCWIHEWRHFKKLIPVLDDNILKLSNFSTKFWNYYKALKKYKENPTIDMKERLYNGFDTLFSKTTGYIELDKRIEKTKNKKSELLLVLEFPEIPLHNNASELAVRVQVRKRDVSLQTRTKEWTDAKNTFLTIVETARKLWVNIYDYIYDRITQKYEMKSLADLINDFSKKNLVLP